MRFINAQQLDEQAFLATTPEAPRVPAWIARTLRDGQERGELRADLDAEIASTIFIGGIDTIVTSRVLEMIRTGDDGPPDEKVYFEQLSRTVVELFIRGMAAPDALGARD